MKTMMNKTSLLDTVVSSAVRGVLCGFDEVGEPLIDFPTNLNSSPIAAISTVPLTESDLNREVVLLFEDGDFTRPIIIGLRQSPAVRPGQSPVKSQSLVTNSPIGPAAAGIETTEVKQPAIFELDGERIVYTAQREIVLRCGKASIQLLSDGSVRIRGTNVLSRASATNRIRGGNVQIN